MLEGESVRHDSTCWTCCCKSLNSWSDVGERVPMRAALQLASACISLSACKRVGLVMDLCLKEMVSLRCLILVALMLQLWTG